MFLKVCVFFVAVGVTNASPLAASVINEEQSRIIGGVQAPEKFAPHMVALITGEYTRLMLCGGSIISPILVLTAAHCLTAVVLPDGGLRPSFHARVGSNNWNSGGTIVHLEKYHIHPQWDSKYIKYDVAILVLKEKLVLGDAVAVVPLGFGCVGENERCVVSGWGWSDPKIEDNIVNLSPTPDALQLLSVLTLNHKECQRLMKEVAGKVWTPHIDKKIEICTFHSRGHGVCLGDSGSALIQEETGKQIGLVSWGFDCAVGAPDVFVRLSGVKAFLKSYMAAYED